MSRAQSPPPSLPPRRCRVGDYVCKVRVERRDDNEKNVISIYSLTFLLLHSYSHLHFLYHFLSVTLSPQVVTATVCLFCICQRVLRCFCRPLRAVFHLLVIFHRAFCFRWFWLKFPTVILNFFFQKCHLIEHAFLVVESLEKRKSIS